MALTFNALYLGNPGVMIDPTENDTGGAINQTAENAALLVGRSFGGPGAALADDWVSVTSRDMGGTAGVLDMNNSLADDQIIVNSGPQAGTYTFDGVAVYDATITYLDGTVVTTQLVVAQMTNGDLYVLPSPVAGTAGNAALAGGPIASIDLTRLVNNVYAGATADRSVISFITCFALGARIMTPRGPRRVEDLAAGDLVITADHGPQPILLITRHRVSAAEMDERPDVQPLRLAPMCLAPLGIPGPTRALILSQQHRVAVPDAGRPGAAGEVLVPARALRALAGVSLVRPVGGVAYFHLLLPRHEVIFAEGIAVESLFTGDQVLRSMSPGLRAGVMARHGVQVLHATPARPLMAMRPAQQMVQERQAQLACPLP